MRYVSKGIGLLLSIGIVSNSWGIGGANIGNEVPSARAAGQGYVGVAGQNDDPTVAWSNAGGITSLPGTQFTIGGTWENVHGTYDSNGGAQTKERVTNVVAPNMSATHTLMDGQVGFGLSIQTPYGLETHWDGNSPLRYVATDSRLAVTFISPSVALQVTPQFSIGAGFDYADLSNAQLDRHVNVDAVNAGYALNGVGTPSANSPDGIASLRGTGNSWGGHAGFVYTPFEKHAFGVTYHSEVTVPVDGSVKLSGLSGTAMNVFGGSDYSTDAHTQVVLPENVQLGYSYKPTSKWAVEADAAWYHWSDDQNLTVNYNESNPLRLAVLNTGNPTPLALRDAWSFSVGANYKYSDRWQYRSGFWYEPYAQNASAFTPAYQDLSRYGLSAGTGYAISSHLTIDVAYTAVFFHNRGINNNVGAATSGIPNTGIPALGIPSADISGTYKDFANLVAVNLTYKFGAQQIAK
jgi:long-chain fatty acid transport protein